jgi:hypothetical protein
MSERRILVRTFDNWLDAKRVKFGEDWLGEMSWKMTDVINQFTRYAGFMYSSTSDFTDWLDNEFDSVIVESMRKTRKDSLIGLEV